MPYCPNCGDEIEAAVERCPSCEAGFGPGAAWRPLAMPPADRDPERIRQLRGRPRDGVLRKIPLFLYLPFVFAALISSLLVIGRPPDGMGFAAMLVVFLVGLPWSFVVFWAANPVADSTGLLLIWSCIAVNAGLLAYLGWRKIRRPPPSVPESPAASGTTPSPRP
jgi:hypothetical protein